MSHSLKSSVPFKHCVRMEFRSTASIAERWTQAPAGLTIASAQREIIKALRFHRSVILNFTAPRRPTMYQMFHCKTSYRI